MRTFAYAVVSTAQVLVPDLPFPLAKSLLCMILGASGLSAFFVLLDLALAALLDEVDGDDGELSVKLICGPPNAEDDATEEENTCMLPFPCF